MNYQHSRHSPRVAKHQLALMEYYSMGTFRSVQMILFCIDDFYIYQL